jgi:HK97 gp10 family phage protein
MSKLTRNISNPNGISMYCSIEGLDDVIQGMKMLYQEDVKGVYTKVNYSVAKVLIDEIRRNVPEKNGHLRNSISAFQSKKNENFLWVGPRYEGKNGLFKGGNHAHLVEYGTVDRYVGVKSKYVAANLSKAGVRQGFKGKMTPHPFIRPAYDKMKGTILKLLIEGYNKTIEDIAKKTGVFRW